MPHRVWAKSDLNMKSASPCRPLGSTAIGDAVFRCKSHSVRCLPRRDHPIRGGSARGGGRHEPSRAERPAPRGLRSGFLAPLARAPKTLLEVPRARGIPRWHSRDRSCSPQDNFAPGFVVTTIANTANHRISNSKRASQIGSEPSMLPASALDSGSLEPIGPCGRGRFASTQGCAHACNLLLRRRECRPGACVRAACDAERAMP